MLRKVLLTLVLVLCCIPSVNAEDKHIEILDIEKDQIIKTIPTNKEIQDETVKVVKEINGIVKAFNPIPSKGEMIKIPLEPTYHIENKWMNAIIDEVIVIVPEDGEPFLLLFNDENNSNFLTTKSDFGKLLDLIAIPGRKVL